MTNIVSLRNTGGVTRMDDELYEALIGTDLAEQNNHLQLVVAEQAPKVRALALLAETDGAICITAAAKQGLLVHKLKVLGINDDTGQQKVAEQVLVTRKGLALLGEKLAGRVA